MSAMQEATQLNVLVIGRRYSSIQLFATLVFFLFRNSTVMVSAERQQQVMQLEPTTSSSEPSGLPGSAPCPPPCPHLARSVRGAQSVKSHSTFRQHEDLDRPDLSWNSVRHRDAFREIRLGARRRLQLGVSHLGHQFDSWTQSFSR